MGGKVIEARPPTAQMYGGYMRRREFITLLGGAVGWPLAARAQPSSMPLVGVLETRSPGETASILAALREGLKEVGCVEGQNVAIEYRWAERQFGRLPVLAAELARRQTAVIFAATIPGALAAQAVTPPAFSCGYHLECGQSLLRARLRGDAGRGQEVDDRVSVP